MLLPSVAVIMPAYNAERFIAEAIESVIAQTHHDWQMVVVDDGSTDRTLEIARSFAERDSRITVITGPNAGIANAMNRATAVIDTPSDGTLTVNSVPTLSGVFLPWSFSPP